MIYIKIMVLFDVWWQIAFARQSARNASLKPCTAWRRDGEKKPVQAFSRHEGSLTFFQKEPIKNR
jgi:hypothetical protein